MGILCAICYELLLPSEEIVSFRCGHVFHDRCLSLWLERSRTCPQCRETVAENGIHRVYHTFLDSEIVSDNANSSFLQARIDSLQFQILMKDKNSYISKNATLGEQIAGLRQKVHEIESEINQKNSAIHALKKQRTYFEKKYKDLAQNSCILKNATLEKQNADLRQGVRKVESEIIQKNSVIHDLKEQITHFKEEHKVLAQKLSQKEKELEQFKYIRNTLSKGSLEDIRKVIKKTKDRDTLVTCISVMRKEFEERLEFCKSENISLRDRLSVLENYQVLSRKNHVLSGNQRNSPNMTSKEEDITIKEVLNLTHTTVSEYKGLVCRLANSIIGNLLIHPFVVLRRQCQVNPGAIKYHLTPITLIPIIVRLHWNQGRNTLWKGIVSVLLVKGITLAVEDLISRITSWPKKITCDSSYNAFGQHILLKCVSIGIVTTFHSVSLVETVQSKITSEYPGILNVFRNGAIRLLAVCNKDRLIPIYALVPPTIVYEVSKYLFTLIVRGVSSGIMHVEQTHSQEARVQDIESIFVSTCAADIVFYPFETVIHRLYLQNTLTIIDNLDTGRSVTSLLTGYSSVADCYRTIISTEGTLGLYKGFGALIMQIFAVHFTKNWARFEAKTEP